MIGPEATRHRDPWLSPMPKQDTDDMQTISNTAYAVQTFNQRKHGGGIGRGDRSFHKLEFMEYFMMRQIPVLSRRGRGLIIDMNAGDGQETPHVQKDFFADGALISTPHLAIRAARRFGADVWLCEKSAPARKRLKELWGNDARIFGNHNTLSKHLDLVANYPWLFVLSDPNGHGDSSNGVTVMAKLSEVNHVSDFVVVVNLQSLWRHQGLRTTSNHDENVRVTAARASKERYSWMVDPNQWAQHLGKRQVMERKPIHQQGAMRAQVLLISNWIAGYGR